jgi:hypothetical protein
VLPISDIRSLRSPVRSSDQLRTTNDAHKYLREPPTVKRFSMKTSTAANRKSSGQPSSSCERPRLPKVGMQLGAGKWSEEFEPRSMQKE